MAFGTDGVGMSDVKVAYNGIDKFRANYDRIFREPEVTFSHSGIPVSREKALRIRRNMLKRAKKQREEFSFDYTPHASDEGIPPPSLSSCEPRGVTYTDMQPIYVSGVVHNPFTGDWFGWVL